MHIDEPRQSTLHHLNQPSITHLTHIGCIGADSTRARRSRFSPKSIGLKVLGAISVLPARILIDKLQFQAHSPITHFRRTKHYSTMVSALRFLPVPRWVIVYLWMNPKPRRERLECGVGRNVLCKIILRKRWRKSARYSIRTNNDKWIDKCTKFQRVLKQCIF